MDKRELRVYLAHPWRERGDTMVASAILIKEGVWCGNKGCVLHTGETIKNSVRAWNGIPVTMGHPELDGEAVSVRTSQEIFSRYAIGHLERPRFKEGKLMADVVVETQDEEVRQLLQRGRELSTGMFTHEIESQGVYEEREYSMIAQFYTPDHLALLSDSPGACSWEDGCGIGAHQRGDDMSREKLLPPGVKEKEPKVDLKAIQEAADKADMLLPTEMNKGEQSGPGEPDDDPDILMPTGF